MKKYLNQIIALILWAMIIIALQYYKGVNHLSSLDLAQELHHYVTQNSNGILIFILIHTLRSLTLFPPLLLTILGGTLFGFWWGIVITVVGENISANFSYFLGQLFGKKSIDNEGKGLIHRWKKNLHNHSFIAVLIIRMIYIPFDLVNYTCGILHVNWVNYAIGTFLGILPSVITFVGIGASIKNFESFNPRAIEFDSKLLLMSIILFLLSLIMAHLLQKSKKKLLAK